MKKTFVAYPYVLWAALFIIIPLVIVVYFSCFGSGEFSLKDFERAFEPTYMYVMLKSLITAGISTIICLLLGYPVAYILARMSTGKRDILLFLIVAPMWMNFLLRTYAWMSILERNGIINQFISFLGFPKLELLYNSNAVILGMIYNFLPFMILPIYTALTKMEHSYVEAAQDLGASKLRVFFRVIFPLSMPGVMSGITMVFMPAVTTFVISKLLGGGQFLLIGDIIEQQFTKAGNWGFGSALSVVLMVVIMISIAFTSKYEKENAGGGLF